MVSRRRALARLSSLEILPPTLALPTPQAIRCGPRERGRGSRCAPTSNVESARKRKRPSGERAQMAITRCATLVVSITQRNSSKSVRCSKSKAEEGQVSTPSSKTKSFSLPISLRPRGPRRALRNVPTLFETLLILHNSLLPDPHHPHRPPLLLLLPCPPIPTAAPPPPRAMDLFRLSLERTRT